MIFIMGSFFGVLIFAEGYPAFESLYKSANLGNPRIFQTLNISENLFAFLTVLVALAAFYFVSLIEKKVNKEEVAFFKLDKQNVLMAGFGFLLLILSLTMTDRKSFFLKLVEDENFVKNYPLEEMTSDELAFRLTCQKCEQLRIIDLRNAEEYNKWSLPNSTLFTVDNLFEKEPNLFLRMKHTKRVFVADDEMTERKAAIMAVKMGYKDIRILKGGLNGFTKEILQFEPIKEPKTIDDQYRNRFRSKAKIEIAELIKNNKPQGAVQKTQKRALGGC
jgi:rhodanese-related sulfurtransferase